MSVTKSPYILLAKLKAKYELERDRRGIGMIIRLRHARNVKKLNKLKTEYNYIPERHKELFSSHAVARDYGCGCAYCTALHEYAFAKLNLHYFKKSFESEYEMEMFSHKPTPFFSVSNNFYALYSEHSAKVEKEKQLTYLEFFNKIKEERKKEIKTLRTEYKSIKEAIQTILSS